MDTIGLDKNMAVFHYNSVLQSIIHDTIGHACKERGIAEDRVATITEQIFADILQTNRDYLRSPYDIVNDMADVAVIRVEDQTDFYRMVDSIDRMKSGRS